MKKALDALHLGMAMESQGEAFYRLSAERVTSQAAKDIFLGLADWEAEHQKYIQEQIDSLTNDKKWQSETSLPTEASQLGPSVYRARSVDYPNEPSLPVSAKTTELSALRMALFIEDDLKKYYLKAADETTDPEGKIVFLKLAEWEDDHKEMLESRYEYMKEAYFDALGVSPGY